MKDMAFETECAVAFLQAFDCDGWHNLVAIDPSGSTPPVARTFPPHSFAEIVDWVNRHNGVRNLYFSVNEPAPNARRSSKLRKDEIAAIRAIYTDIDPRPSVELAAERKRLRAVAEESDADIVIDSGGGVQLFWCLSEKAPAASFEWAEGSNRCVAQEYGGDHTWDVNRIMRLPFTLNLPDTKKRLAGRQEALAQTLRANTGKWSRTTLEAAFPPIPAQNRDERSADTNETAKCIAATDYSAFTEYDDLPPELRRRFEGAQAGDGNLRDLWQGDGAGNEYRFALAGRLKALGFNAADYACLASVWSRSTSKPDLPSPRELARDWDRCRATASASQEFDAVHIEGSFADPRAAGSAAPLRSISMRDARVRVYERQPTPLVQGCVRSGGFVVLYGAPGKGKSFLAIDLAVAIASGQTWAGRPTHRGAVLYIGAEGGDRDLMARATAAAEHRSATGDDLPLELVPDFVDLVNNKSGADAVIEKLAEMKRHHGVEPHAVVIDTLARSFGGRDETAGPDMNLFVRNVDRIRLTTGVAAIVLHHSGKDEARGARGHSSLLGAIDTEFEVKAGRLRNSKQRTFPLSADIRFELNPYSLGQDKSGEEIKSCVVQFANTPEMTFTDVLISQPAERLLQALFCDGADPGVSWQDWFGARCRLDAPDWRIGETTPKGCSDQNLRKLRSELIDAGRVAEIATNRFARVKSSAQNAH